jgi:superfamily II DNA or RNA helicase
MDELFKAIREECTAQEWSAGVQLSRQDAVTLLKQSKKEIELRVTLKGGLSSALVSLYPEDEDWSCDATKQDAAMPLIAAAVIALRLAKKEGRDLRVNASSSGYVRYELKRAKHAIHLSRSVVIGDTTRPIGASLTLMAKSIQSTGQLVITSDDLEVERMTGGRGYEAHNNTQLTRLFKVLESCEHIQFEGKSFKVGRPQCGLRAIVEDRGPDFMVTLKKDSDVRGLISGIMLTTEACVHALVDPNIPAEQMRQLKEGKVFRNQQVSSLITQLLPKLKKVMPVIVKTKRLPKLSSMPARLQIQTDSEGESLFAQASIVYGNPVCARLDGDSLTHIQGSLPIRNAGQELQLIQKLANELVLKPGVKERFTGAEAVEFSEKLETFGSTVVGAGHANFFKAPMLEPIAQEGESAFGISFRSRGARKNGQSISSQVSPQAVVEAWQRGDSMIGLQGGGFAPIPASWLAAHGRALQDLIVACDGRTQMPKALLPDLARLYEAMDEVPPMDFKNLETLIKNFEGLPQATLPQELRAELRSYQRTGVNWLCFLREAQLGGMLADDMGLGKTLQALTAIQGKCLVVAPTSVLFNWRNEIEKFRPGLKVSLYHGPRRSMDEQADITLTSYAIMRLDIEQLENIQFKTIVLDESQFIKNPASLVAQAAFRLNGEFRMTLSGTPVENRLSELWSQFNFINPGLLGGLSDFKKRYAKPMEEGDAVVTKHLQERIRPFILRRHKRDVAKELPPRTDTVLHCQLDEDERVTYDTIRAATQQELLEKLEMGASIMDALEALLRLRQASCHRGLIPGQTAATSSKVTLLLRTLEQALQNQHKCLVFSQWTGLLDLVGPELTERNMDYCRLDGSTRNREEVVQTFQADDGPPIMLLSLKAGGTGLNLTAADQVFLLDPWWNPAVEDQAADRAHRIGQENPVLVHRMVAQDTVEEKILELQDKKRALAQAAIGGGSAAASLSRDDLVALLR